VETINGRPGLRMSVCRRPSLRAQPL